MAQTKKELAAASARISQAATGSDLDDPIKKLRKKR
jgi:hypothetical protein